MDPLDPALPGPGLIPYTVNAPLYSDDLDKERYFALPEATNVTINADGDMDFPVGTVFIKTFKLGGQPIETRLLIRHAQDVWGGYSYRWNDAGTDATLLPAGDTKTLSNGQVWSFPSRPACLACHTQGAGRSLGPEVLQLNGGFLYEDAGIFANQLVTLDHINVLDLPAAVATLPALTPPSEDNATFADRARSYLHANCAMCHRANGTGQSQADMRFSVPFVNQQLCNVDPQEGTLGVVGAKLVVPGDPARSLVSLRMHSTASGKMPPLARSLVDPLGTGIVDLWITSLTGCP
jgi:uncharacterized repeat protein (TIGR03806 family)